MAQAALFVAIFFGLGVICSIMPHWLRIVAHANPLSNEVTACAICCSGSRGQRPLLDFAVALGFLVATALSRQRPTLARSSS
jgi:hypothetical protein